MDASPRTARDVFLAALKLPAEEREAYLQEACGEDQDLHRRVSALLQAQAEIGSFHEAPALTVDQPSTESPGTVIGPYKLLEPIGEGGMGTVWMARQQVPVKRSVAIKLIKAGMDSAQVLARFEAERQALARMDHPNIARVLDAGYVGQAFQPDSSPQSQAGKPDLQQSPAGKPDVPQGRPYFVMELVKGVPITRYCDEHRLTPRQRLELFIPVCQAIQHAHQKGIIHRDVKPSNVLVTLYDDRPVPKVIDFGVAKATGEPLTEATLHTGFGAAVGTIEYMSPEQASFNALDVDTRSDVYSLGVLLYELLVGSPPFSRREMEQGGLLELLRVIREQEPTKPSLKLSTAEELATLAGHRSTEPAKLTRLLRGELDWIVLRALEKDRNRRYETANAFAADVQRYLADEPVLACPPSAAYRFRKFARRNRTALAAGALVALAVLAAVGGLIVSNVRIDGEKKEKEAALAEAEDNLLLARQAVNDMYEEVANQLFALPHMQPFQRHVLQKALRFYQEFARRRSRHPAIRLEAARAALRVLTIRWLLGQPGPYEQPCREAIAVLQQLAEELPPEPKYRLALAQAHAFLGEVLHNSGRQQEAERCYRQALTLYGELAAERSDVPAYRAELAAVQNSLGGHLLHDWPGEAEKCHRVAIRLCEALAAERPDVPQYQGERANSYYLLGYLLARVKRHSQAEDALRQAVAICDKVGAPLDRTSYRFVRAQAQYHLGVVLRAQRRDEEAETALRQAVASAERTASQFPDILSYRERLTAYYLDLARVLAQRGRSDQAAPFRRLALDLNEKLVEARTFDDPLARAEARAILVELGKLLRDAGELKGAERVARKALEVAKKLAAESPAEPAHLYQLALAHSLLGTVLERARRMPAAADEFRKGLAVCERLAAAHPTDPDYRWRQASAANFLGIALRRLPTEREAAVRHHRQAIELCAPLVARFPDNPRYRRELVRGHYALGLALWMSGRWNEAQASYRQALAVCTSPVQEVLKAADSASIHNNWAWLLATCPDRKVRDPRRAVQLAKKAVDLDPLASYWNTLGAAWCRAGNGKEALAPLQKSMDLTRGGNSFDWFFVAMAHGQLGDKAKARTWYDRAVMWMDKHQPKDDELRRFRAEAAELLKIEEGTKPK